MTNAFEVSMQTPRWGLKNNFYNNRVSIGADKGYVLNVSTGATAKARNNTRIPANNSLMYSGNVTQY